MWATTVSVAAPMLPAQAMQPLRRPRLMRAVRGRHVLGHGGVAAAHGAAGVTGDAPMVVEHLHRDAGHAQLDLLADELVRHRVVVALELDVVIEARDLRPLELGVFERGRRQRPNDRAFEQFEPRAARALQFLERPVVEVLQQLADGGVEFGEAEEAPMPQPGEDPALDQLHRGFDLGLGVERALHMVTSMAHKYLPSPIRSIRCEAGALSFWRCATTGVETACRTRAPTGGCARCRLSGLTFWSPTS